MMNNERKNLLVFGYGLALILSFIATKHWAKHGWDALDISLLVAALILSAISLINVQWIKPFYKGWMRVAGVIGHIVTSVILSFLFLVIFGFVGILMRLLKKDPLDRTIDINKNSYWIKRDNLFDKSSYKRQF